MPAVMCAQCGVETNTATSNYDTATGKAEGCYVRFQGEQKEPGCLLPDLLKKARSGAPLNMDEATHLLTASDVLKLGLKIERRA